MRKFLIAHFIKDSLNTSSPKVREAYGKLAGTVGIVTNVFLCILKGLLGYFTGSIAIIADAVNNLSDAACSAVTLIGFKLAAKERDEEHPYGHARIEYMTGIVISALVILLGFKLLSDSFQKTLTPEPVEFNYFVAVGLIVAIALKIWQALFNYSLSKTIDSKTLRATAADSRNDSISTSAVLIAFIIGKIVSINIDGYIGVAVAAFIIVSGFRLIKDTTGPLLGQAPDPEIVQKIKAIILDKPGVMGMHDLVIHDYGPGRLFASVHIEVNAKEDILVSHETIDMIEKEALEHLNVELVGHMDPVDTEDQLVYELRDLVTERIADISGIVGMHDLRIVRGENQTKVIFDLVLSAAVKPNEKEITDILDEAIKESDPTRSAVITFDVDYAPARK